MMLKYKYKINRTNLKLIALVAMLLDHIAVILLENRLGIDFYEIISGGFLDQQKEYMKIACCVYVIFRSIGRISFPIFCFLLIDGLERTSNCQKWLFRLFTFGVISEIPYSLSFFGKCFNDRQHNVFFTLFLGLLLIIILSKEENDESKFKWSYLIIALIDIDIFFNRILNRKDFLLILCLVSILIFIYIANDVTVIYIIKRFLIIYLFIQICIFFKCEYSYSAMLVFVSFYYLRNKKIISSMVSVFFLICLETLELFSIISLVPILAYDKNIDNRNLKKLFYLFYPIHLMVLYVVKNIIHLIEIK